MISSITSSQGLYNCRGTKHGVKVVGATNTMGRCQVRTFSRLFQKLAYHLVTLKDILGSSKSIWMYNGTLSGQSIVETMQAIRLFLWFSNNKKRILVGKIILLVVAMFIAKWRSKLPVPLFLSFLKAHWRLQWDFSHQHLYFMIPELLDHKWLCWLILARRSACH